MLHCRKPRWELYNFLHLLLVICSTYGDKQQCHLLHPVRFTCWGVLFSQVFNQLTELWTADAIDWSTGLIIAPFTQICCQGVMDRLQNDCHGACILLDSITAWIRFCCALSQHWNRMSSGRKIVRSQNELTGHIDIMNEKIDWSD